MKTLALLAAILLLSFGALTVYFGFTHGKIVWAISIPFFTTGFQALGYARKKRDEEVDPGGGSHESA